MEIKNVNHLLTVQLQELYSVEDQLIKSIPILIDHASSTTLKKGLMHHLEETKDQFDRIKDIGDQTGVVLAGVADLTMMYLLKSGLTLIQQTRDHELKDMVIIGGSLKVEHYEMAFYKAVSTVATAAGEQDIASVMMESYKEEEEATARKLEMMSMGGLAKAATGMM